MVGKTPWKSRIFPRYLLYQVPGWSLGLLVLIFLRKWLASPWWLVSALTFILVLKDLILFPYVWMAYGAGFPGKSPLPGSRGVVVKPLAPAGYIRIGGELWRALNLEGERPIPVGESVTVEEILGLTLFVKPATPRTRQPLPQERPGSNGNLV
jgi:membrane protein implicated in regulation of membrane protease activity